MATAPQSMPDPLWKPVTICVGALALLWTPLVARSYLDGPPPAYTGGFGEPSCMECHFDGELDDPAGTLTVEGVPEVYTSGDRYVITVTVSRPEMGRGGFELAARFADGEHKGEQAGTLRATDDRATATPGPEGDIQYLHHTADGTDLIAPDTARWTLEWTPPDTARGNVVFHVAANAANGDDSAFGDWIYLRSVTSSAGPETKP